MSKGNRVKRVEEQVRRVISERLIREVHLDKIERVTVTDVDMSPDLRNATIYFSILADDDKQKDTIFSDLNKHKGELRYILGREMELRVVPELHFEIDESVEKAARIDELINKIHEKE